MVNESDYIIDCGNLYFKKSIEAIVSEKYSGFEDFLAQSWANELIESTIYYNVRVVFDRFVPDTTDETNSLALAQATSYAIMDYFNQYTYAEISSNMISEVAYTETLTFWSTLISAPLVYFGSWAVSTGVGKMFGEAGFRKVQAMLQKSVMGGLVGMVVSPIKEVFQEIIEDGFREALIENLVSIAGGTDDLGFWLSSLSTSFREVKGALGELTFGDTNLKNTFSLIHAISSGDTDTMLEIQQKITQELKQRKEAETAKKEQMSFWDKMVKTGFLKGLFMVMPSVFFGSFGFVALSGLNKMVTSSIKLSPAAYAWYKTKQHVKAKKDLNKMAKDQKSFSVDSFLFNNMDKQTKKPSELDGEALNNIFRGLQNNEIESPPLTIAFPNINPNPKTESRKVLANKFNTIAFEQFFDEWIDKLGQDDRFEPFKEDFKRVQKNYKQIGIQKAEKEIINQIHEILEDHPQRLRWANMFGTIMYDPLLSFAGFSRASVELLRNYDIADNKKSKEKIIEDIQRITGIAVDLDLIHISGDHVPDGTRDVIQWLKDRDFTVDDKIVVVPKVVLKEGFGLFDKSNWDKSKTSPYHPFFEQFLEELFDTLKNADVIVSSKAKPSLYHISKELSPLTGHSKEYFLNLLAGMKVSNDNKFLPSGINFDKWYFSFKEKILTTHALSPQDFSQMHDLDPFIGISIKGQEAIYRLDQIFLKYNLIFGIAKNDFALEMRRTCIRIMDFFSLDAINDLIDIIGYWQPSAYYGIKHPNDRPYGIESVLNRLIVDPLKYIINDKTGQIVAQNDIVINEKEMTMQINFGGSFVLIDYNKRISISFSDTISSVLRNFMNNYFDVVKGAVDNVLSYWRVNAQLSGYKDSFKKAFYSKIFQVMNRFIPIFEDIPLEKISSLFYPDLQSDHLLRTLSGSQSRSLDISKLDRLKINILQMKLSDLNNLFERKLTKTGFKYMQAEILKQIDKFVLTYTIEKTPNSKVFKYAYYSNLPYQDKKIIYNFISNILMVTKLEGQRNIPLGSLKSVYPIGDAIINLRRRGFPTKYEHSLVNDLKEIYNTIYRWFERDFGTRDPVMIRYGKLSRNAYNKYYYYSKALRSIEDLCRYKGYDFASPSITGVHLLNAIENKKELIMNAYDLKYWEDGKLGETVKTFHRVYHLTKYLGFDPLFFMGLDSELSKSHRHHFLGVLFRKMSSYVGDHVLTTVALHRSYDTLFDSMGERQAQAFIEGLLATIEELIWLTDKNGNFKELTKADIPLIKSILKKHLGTLSGKAWTFWTKGIGGNTKTTSQFLNDLNEFNNRRKYIMAPDGKLIQRGFEKFLQDKFIDFYRSDFQKVTHLNPELFLGSKKDFIFMNFVYIGVHRFDLDNL
ncbi:hypothetical protein ES703_40227 [subsurface metagenome]